MAVFMLNICKFNSCGLTFRSLGHLIQHIEETHIDYDPTVIKKTELQQPTCIPLSYVLRFLTDAARKQHTKPIVETYSSPALSNSIQLPQRTSVTPTVSEADEDDDSMSETEDSNDSWTTTEEFSGDYAYRCQNRNANQTAPGNKEDKPFACPIPGCKKRYKNVNGIKYHSKNGHKNDGKVHKVYKCPCGKSYKTSYGLKNHTTVQHNGSVHQIKVVLPNKTLKFDGESNYANSITVEQQSIDTASDAVNLKLPKIKVLAHHDHVYIKSVNIDSVAESANHLGILTPASSPPLTHPSKNADSNSGSMKSLQNYFISSSQTQSRKSSY